LDSRSGHHNGCAQQRQTLPLRLRLRLNRHFLRCDRAQNGSGANGTQALVTRGIHPVTQQHPYRRRREARDRGRRVHVVATATTGAGDRAIQWQRCHRLAASRLEESRQTVAWPANTIDWLRASFTRRRRSLCRPSVRGPGGSAFALRRRPTPERTHVLGADVHHGHQDAQSALLADTPDGENEHLHTESSR